MPVRFASGRRPVPRGRAAAAFLEISWFLHPNLAITGHGVVREQTPLHARRRPALPAGRPFAAAPVRRRPPCFTRRATFNMSRFGNLEFEGDAEHEFEPGRPAPVKDEAYYLAEARAAFENGNFESGLRFYSKVLEFNPKNAAAWTGQVRMLIELGEFREARLPSQRDFAGALACLQTCERS